MRFIALLLLIAWTIFATWKCMTVCCGVGVGAGGAATKAALWKVTDGGKVVADAAGTLCFYKGDATAQNSKPREEGLRELADYLKNNPKKKLTILGKYAKGERGNTNGLANLGEARAANIKKRIVGFGGDSNRIEAKGRENTNATFSKDNGKETLCNDNSLVYIFGTADAPKPAVNNNVAPGLSIRDGSLLAATAGGNFLFDKDGYRVNQPIQGDVKNALQKTVTHLKKNPDKVVTITGPYGKNEKNTGAFENLGIARANSVKNEMVTLGATRSQIETKGRLINNIKFNDKNKLVGGVDFAFSKAKKNDDKLAQIEKRLKIGPKYLYFETGKDVVKLNSELRKYFADLVYYLDRKPNAKVNVVGHTDSQGGRASNIKLGQGRADFVKRYLANNGTGTNQIRTSSKGPDKPIDSNDTAAGRQKNRRVEVRVP